MSHVMSNKLTLNQCIFLVFSEVVSTVASSTFLIHFPSQKNLTRIKVSVCNNCEYWTGSHQSHIIAHGAKTRQIEFSAICKVKLKEHGLINNTKKRGI